MAISDFLHRLSKFSEQLRTESVFLDSTELIKLENQNRIDVQNPQKAQPNSPDNSVTLHTKTKLLTPQLKQVMVSCLYHVGMGRRPYP